MRIHLKYKCKKINWSPIESENSHDNTLNNNIEDIGTKSDSDIEMIAPKTQASGLDWNLVNENNFDMAVKNNRPKEKSKKIRMDSRSDSNKGKSSF